MGEELLLSGKVVKLVVAGVLVWAFFRWFERANLYIPDKAHLADPGAYALPYEAMTIATPDGERLDAWFIDAAKPDTRAGVPNDPPLPKTERLPGGKPSVLVFFNGNGGNISYRLQKLRIFRGMGLSVLMFDYRGYGRSSGRPSENGTYVDGEAVVDWLEMEKGVSAGDAIYYGESLGCAVALETAIRRPPKALILDSGFTSTVDMGRRVFPFLPVRWMVRYKYDNAAKIGKLKAPLLIAHSPQDDIVPFEMGRRLFEAALDPKEFLELTGTHNEGYADSPNYGPRIRAFLARVP